MKTPYMKGRAPGAPEGADISRSLRLEETASAGSRFLPVITGLFVGILILSNILASKMVHIGPAVFDGGTLLFPLSSIFGDLLTEVYGDKASRSRN